MRLASPTIRGLLATSLCLLASGVHGSPLVQGAATSLVSLDNPNMLYLNIVEDLAIYEWTVDVRNNSNEPMRLRIIFDLLDDDDQPINRDEQNNPQDFVIIDVEPGQTVPVEQQGSLGYDRAAQVVTYRHRWEILQGVR